MAKQRKRKPFSNKKTKGFIHPLGFCCQDERRPFRAIRFGKLFPEIAAKFGLMRRLGNERWEQAWQEIFQSVIEPVFRSVTAESNIRFAGLRNGVLRIEVGDNLILQEISFYRSQILDGFRNRIPDEKINDIKFVVKRL